MMLMMLSSGNSNLPDETKRSGLMTSRLLYLTPVLESAQILTTRLLYLTPVYEQAQLLTTRLLVLVAETQGGSNE